MTDNEKLTQEEINEHDRVFLKDMEEMLLGVFMGFMADTGMSNTPEARVLCYTTLLSAAREEPFNDDLILQKLAETFLEREIYKAKFEVASQMTSILRSWRG